MPMFAFYLKHCKAYLTDKVDTVKAQIMDRISILQ